MKYLCCNVRPEMKRIEDSGVDLFFLVCPVCNVKTPLCVDPDIAEMNWKGMFKFPYVHIEGTPKGLQNEREAFFENQTMNKWEKTGSAVLLFIIFAVIAISLIL